MRIVHAARTDVGLKRDNNEDNYSSTRGGLFAVFDGMGGHAGRGGERHGGAGDARVLRADWPRSRGDLALQGGPREELRGEPAGHRHQAGNQRILDAADIDASKKNMGTTCVAACFVEHGSAARPSSRTRRQPRLPPARREAAPHHHRSLVSRGIPAQARSPRRKRGRFRRGTSSCGRSVSSGRWTWRCTSTSCGPATS